MDKIRELIGKGKLAEAIEAAIDSGKFNSIQNKLYVLRGRFASNEIKSNKGVIEYKEYTLEKNKISESLVGLLHSITKKLNTEIGEPQFLNDRSNSFETYWSVFVNTKSLTRKSNTRVEDISWSNDNKFILTHCLNSSIINIWDFEKRKLKETLRGEGILKKVEFHKYDNSIWAIENESKVVVWQKQVSNDDNYGFIWTREFEITIPEGVVNRPFILDAIYNVHVDRFFTFVLLQEEKSKGNTYLMYFKHEYGDKDKSELHFKEYRSYYKPRIRIKYLDFLNGRLAVIHGDSISILKPEQYESELDGGNDVDFYTAICCDVFVTTTNYGGLNSIMLWNANKKEPTPIKYKYHWNTYSAYSKIISSEAFSLIKLYRGYPFPNVEILTSHEYNGGLYHFRINIDKNLEIDSVHGTELIGHRKKITRLDTKGPGITSASIDGTIQVQFFNRRLNTTEDLGCIINCHPHINPFEWSKWSTDGKMYLAYSDVNGYMHILKLKDEPYKRIEAQGDKLVSQYKTLKKVFFTGIILYLCLFWFLPASPRWIVPIALLIIFFIRKSIYQDIRNNYPHRLKRYNHFGKGI